MKRKSIFIVTLIALACLTALQSCEEESKKITSYYTFTTPVIGAPADGAILDITGATVELKWTSESPEGDPVLADVYFGTSSTPPLYKANHNSLALTVTVEKGKTYYWLVRMKDAHRIPTDSETWSFTIFEPIGIFVGDFLCDEPAEDYSYDVTFVKATATTLTTDNYWNSGWDATFTLDFTAKTYSMPLTVWSTYSAIESGTIDPATGQMVGDYIVYHNGVNIEEGVHTYTKY